MHDSCVTMNLDFILCGIRVKQYLEVFSPKIYKFLVEKYKFSIFAYDFFKVKLKN